MSFRVFVAMLLLSVIVARSGIVFADEAAALLQPSGELSGLSVQETVPPEDISGDRAERTVALAVGLLGTRYRRGGVSPETGFDCSGFVDHVFEKMGISLPHSAKGISRNGERVAMNDLHPGDLVFFRTLRHAFSHVGIYLGDNRFIHAPASGGEVRIEDMRFGYWLRRFNGARRIGMPDQLSPG